MRTCSYLPTLLPLQGIKKCRDDELEHLDTGIEHHAEQVCQVFVYI